MPNKGYRRGADFERRARDKLYNLGASLVVRAAQSKGKVDLVCLWPKRLIVNGYLIYNRTPWLIQCKTGKARMSNQDKEELISLADLTDAKAILAQPLKLGRGVEFVDLATNRAIGVDVARSRSSSHRAVQEDSRERAGEDQTD